MPSNTKKHVTSAKAKAKRAISQAAQALNQSTMRGFRNKGKVAAGRGTGPKRAPATATKRAFTSVAAPAAVGMRIGRGANMTARRNMRSGLERHFVADLYSSPTAGAFATIFDQAINPSNGTLFPRLSAIAGAYERYRFRRFVVHYHPSCSTATAGTVAAYIDPDAMDSADTNMASVLENMMKGGGTPWTPFSFSFRGPRMHGWFFTNGLARTGSATDRQNFPGCLRFVHDKMAGSVALGFLEIEYEVEFADQKPPQALMFNAPAIDWSTTTAITGSTGIVIQDVHDLGFVTSSNTTADSWNTSAHLHGVTFKQAGDDEIGTFVNGLSFNEASIARWLFNLAVNNTAPSPVGNVSATGFIYTLGYYVGAAFTSVLTATTSGSGNLTIQLGAVNNVNSASNAVYVLRASQYATFTGPAVQAGTWSLRTPVLTGCRATSDSSYGFNSLSSVGTSFDPATAVYDLPSQLSLACADLSGRSGLVSISSQPPSAGPSESDRLAALEKKLEQLLSCDCSDSGDCERSVLPPRLPDVKRDRGFVLAEPPSPSTSERRSRSLGLSGAARK